MVVRASKADASRHADSLLDADPERGLARRVPGPLAWDPPLADQDHRWRGWALVAGVLVLAAIVGLFIRLPYDVISPGETRRVNDLMKVK